MSSSRECATGDESRTVAVAVSRGLPVIDLALDGEPSSDRDRAETARAVGDACTEIGFLVVTGHGVPSRVINELRRQTGDFFRRSDEFKQSVAVEPGDPLMRGFGRGRTELLESFTVNRLGAPDAAKRCSSDVDEQLLLPNKWPDIAGFRQAYTEYCAAMEGLAGEIMRLFAVSLGLPGGWFDAAFGSHMSSLTANYYPRQGAAPEPGRMRKEAHRDWGTLTVLYQDETSRGLQVYGRDGQWADVPAVPGTFVINIGDLMARWTNDRWVSTVHRVVNPPAGLAHSARYSFAYFYQPSPGAVVSCIPTCRDADETSKFPPTRADAYFAAKRRREYIKESLVARRVAG
ncbi:isopenicillin N synthase family dioxygenase [Streptomyces pathocidini]|uniref:Isopenicillin N synthase family dioxygenase n=1 Tax=Streptomyces pathocidini TaxID=1650571 RepID=A0ABW7UMN8_9ACTN|nr:isopenicillin N synthase family oxygenase [Streptomyces pathocidini]